MGGWNVMEILYKLSNVVMLNQQWQGWLTMLEDDSWNPAPERTQKDSISPGYSNNWEAQEGFVLRSFCSVPASPCRCTIIHFREMQGEEEALHPFLTNFCCVLEYFSSPSPSLSWVCLTWCVLCVVNLEPTESNSNRAFKVSQICKEWFCQFHSHSQ